MSVEGYDQFMGLGDGRPGEHYQDANGRVWVRCASGWCPAGALDGIEDWTGIIPEAAQPQFLGDAQDIAGRAMKGIGGALSAIAGAVTEGAGDKAASAPKSPSSSSASSGLQKYLPYVPYAIGALLLLKLLRR